MNLRDLKTPFAPEEVEWRVGSTTGDKSRGMALAYIDARAVMDRLDEVCGPQNWQCRYSYNGDRTCCEIGINVHSPEIAVPGATIATTEWVWKADGSGDTDFEGAKGSYSASFKRAAVKWGIGRYLYDLKAPWVAIKPQGKSFVIQESEIKKLTNLLQGRAAAGGTANGPCVPSSTPSPPVGPNKGADSSGQTLPLINSDGEIVRSYPPTKQGALDWAKNLESAVAHNPANLEPNKEMAARLRDRLSGWEMPGGETFECFIARVWETAEPNTLNAG